MEEGRLTRYLSRITPHVPRFGLHVQRDIHVIEFFLILIVLIDVNAGANTENNIRLTAVAESANIDFQHVDGRAGQRYFLETVGSGVAFSTTMGMDSLTSTLSTVPTFQASLQ